MHLGAKGSQGGNVVRSKGKGEQQIPRGNDRKKGKGKSNSKSNGKGNGNGNGNGNGKRKCQYRDPFASLRMTAKN